jgi:hypothetical protein
VFVQVLETVKKEAEKEWKRIGSVQPTPARHGTPDCPVVHRAVSGAPGWLTVNQLLSRIDGVVWLKFTRLFGGAPDCPVTHPRRTCRSREMKKETWLKFTGLSGEPVTPAANGRPRDQCATHGPCQRSVGHPGLSGVHRIVSSAPTDPEDQRSDAPDMEGDRAPDCYSGYPVVHRTVRCTT